MTSASSPATPFEHVLAPRPAESALGPNAAEEESSAHPGADSEDLLAEDFEVYDEDAEFYDDDEEYFAHDENGLPVLVSASDFGRGYQTVEPSDGRVSLQVLNQRKAKRRRRNVTLTVALAGFAALIIGCIVIIRSLLGTEGEYDFDTQAGDTIEFEVAEGDGLETVASRLVDQEIVASREAFLDALSSVDDDATLQPGTFEMREQMPSEDAVASLFGDGSVTGYFGIAQDMRIDETLQQIAEAPGLDIALSDLEELNENPQQFGLPDQATSLEGYLATGEYRPDAEATAEDIIQEAVDITFQRLEESGVTEEDEQWDTIIVASLISAEANHESPEDYPLIASAIENRLNPDHPNYDETDGLLQIDAAVHYGEGSSGDLHFSDETRQDSSNDYNTYVHPGLPPGPIGAPSSHTIDAAANPAESDYLFWVTVNVETGETRFNETYEEHLEDEAVFLEYCSDNPGVCSPADVESAEEDIEG